MAVTGKLRDRLIATARELTTADGWAALTMSKVAGRAGVSRQTVYNELGDKQQLADALVMAELMDFLEVVDDAFTPLPPQVTDGVLAGTKGCLELAERSALVREIVGASHGHESQLISKLTTDSGLLRRTASERLVEHVQQYQLAISDEERMALCDDLVRLILSMIMSPDGTPEEMAARVAWLAGRVLHLPTQ